MLGCTATEAGDRVTYEDLCEYSIWLTIKSEERERQEYYLAQIAGMLSSRKTWNISDYLLKFRRQRQGKLKTLTGAQWAAKFKRVFRIKE